MENNLTASIDNRINSLINEELKFNVKHLAKQYAKYCEQRSKLINFKDF